MDDIGSTTGPSAASIERVAPDHADAQWCLSRYFEELEAVFEGGVDLTRSLPVEAADCVPPRGVTLVARIDGQPVGCGSLKPLRPGVGYIKRMWVAPRARGVGLGARILGELERWAVDLGYSSVGLETNNALVTAVAMYRSRGYVEVEPFNNEHYGDHWFEKKLG